jgi:endonuclease/exonuclease/phosphatase (EEP) superfamily protein YafD
MLLAIAARLGWRDGLPVLVWINSFTLYVYLPAYLLLLAALVARRRTLALPCGVVIAFHACWLLPDVRRATDQPAWVDGAANLRIVSANLCVENPEIESLLDELWSFDANVLVVQELTPGYLERLRGRGASQRYPFEFVAPQTGVSGFGIFSRFPLEQTDLFRIDLIPAARATVQFEGASLGLVAVHPNPPRGARSLSRWNRYWSKMVEVLAQERGPRLLIGDFNATQYAGWYDRCLATGLRSAHRDRGRGMATTWPNGRRKLPPIRIDHALISEDVACISIQEGIGAQSDHRPVVVDLAIRRQDAKH